MTTEVPRPATNRGHQDPASDSSPIQLALGPVSVLLEPERRHRQDLALAHLVLRLVAERVCPCANCWWSRFTEVARRGVRHRRWGAGSPQLAPGRVRAASRRRPILFLELRRRHLGEGDHQRSRRGKPPLRHQAAAPGGPGEVLPVPAAGLQQQRHRVPKGSCWAGSGAWILMAPIVAGLGHFGCHGLPQLKQGV